LAQFVKLLFKHKQSAFRIQQSAISNQQSAISNQQSAISTEHSLAHIKDQQTFCPYDALDRAVAEC